MFRLIQHLCSSAPSASNDGVRLAIILPLIDSGWFLLVCALVLSLVLYGLYRLRRSRGRVPGGLIPLCSSCKKMRDDKGRWVVTDQRILDHPEAVFSHSICPECKEKLYGDYVRPRNGSPS